MCYRYHRSKTTRKVNEIRFVSSSDRFMWHSNWGSCYGTASAAVIVSWDFLLCSFSLDVYPDFSGT